MKQSFTIGSFAIVKDIYGNFLLALRNDLKMRNLPGGGVEDGEAPWEAVVREVKEETGFDVKVVKLIGMYTNVKKNDLWLSYECEITGGESKVNSESDEIKFFSFEEIPKNILPSHYSRLKDYINTSPVIMKIRREGTDQ